MDETSAPMGEADGNLDATDVVEETGTQEAAAEPKGDDYQARIDARLEEMSRTIQDLAQRPYYEPQQEEEEDDRYPLEEGDEGFDEQEAQRVLDQIVNQRVQEALQPLETRQANDRRDRAYEDLKQRLPEFQKDEVSRKYVEAAVRELEEDGNLGAIEDQRLIRLIERMYKADKADERAAQETPARRETSLESSGAAGPDDAEEDLQDRLIRAYKESHTTL